MVQAISHGIPFNDHSRAASVASEAAANLERQSRRERRRSSSRQQQEPQRKKTMEEGIQNAKKFKKVTLDEVDSDFDSENEFSLPTDDDALLISEEDDNNNDSDDATMSIAEDESLWGITSGFESPSETEVEQNNGIEGHSRRRRKRKRRKRRKTRNEARATDSIPPSSSPSRAPTAMPTTSENAIDESSTTAPPVTDGTPLTAAALLVGTTLLDKFYVANQVRIGSTKCELFQCYHVSDVETKHHPLMIKLSPNIGQMQLEHKIYSDLYGRLTQEYQKNLFVKVFDWIPASEITGQQVGFVMEAGLENLRGIIWRHGPMTGDTLRQAMKSVIQTVYALHQLGTVWTEVKAENFVVMPNGNIKAIDLESLAAHGEFLRCYSAETYPPEFPPDSLYNEIPKVPLDYSFDIWGLGLILLEMAIGEPLFTLQRTYDVDYVRERLKNAQGIVDEARQRLEQNDSLDPQARDVILQCLVVDPAHRSTCEQLLAHGYFQNN